MVISHKHRFIFIKTAKTAGTSIEAFLSPHCGPDDVFTPTFPIVEGHQPRNWQQSFFPLNELLSFNYEVDRTNFVERRFFTPKRTLADMLKRRKRNGQSTSSNRPPPLQPSVGAAAS
ncbi:MAG: hypothetical protein EAZ65_02830 [Verrucomicrobia bacterium]|nr:MAG: hypothetical protein EAZ82_03515 [Verrucomicrobiota bacterium]TAF26772.1 MAG: hypothetical protein EAZ71_02825 [Verrucomicrobiota bacterium]TAF42028.1 MAG: hypothetical protein EAZ65_02830 [Verrucomicrobiota bacterium]